MVSSLGFVFHDGVRISAAASLAPLLTCAIEAHLPTELVQKMWTSMVDEMIKVLLDESSQDTIVDLILGLDKVCCFCGLLVLYM